MRGCIADVGGGGPAGAEVMMGPAIGARVWLATGVTDMRKSLPRT